MKEAFETGTARDREQAATEIILNLDEQLPWLEARQFIGLTLSQRPSGWLLIIRSQYGTKNQVMFVGGGSPAEIFLDAAYMILFGLCSWKADKYRTIRNDKKGKTE